MPRPEVSIVQANSEFPEDALIIVYSSLTNLNFRSSMGMIDKQSYNSQSNRYEVLVRPIKQILLVYTNDYMEGTIAKLNPKSKEVFYYKVEEKNSEITAASTGRLTILSEPAGAEIYLNGFKVADKTPFTFDLNSGSTKVKLKKKKFEDFDTTIFIRSNQNSELKQKLNSSYLYLNVTSNPSGANVSIDGVQIGTTPLNKEIDLSNKVIRGTKLLSIALPSYTGDQKEIRYYPSNFPLEYYFDLTKIKGSYSITSNPSGASVYFNGTYKGLTPLSGIIEHGSYEVSLQMDEYKSIENTSLSLNSSEIQYLNFDLERIVALSDQEVLNDLYLRAVSLGYKKTENDFSILIKNDNEVFMDMLNYAKSQGYVNGEDDFAIMVGRSNSTASDFEFSEIKIGNQIWMAENLNTNRFQNGDLIAEARTDLEWKHAGENKQSAWCYYDNDPINAEKYGRLYNWYAVADSRRLCPSGWHVPSDNEWTILTDYLGGSLENGVKMKSKSGWLVNGSGSNSSEFNGLPGGCRFYRHYEYFNDVGIAGYWWSLSDDSVETAYFRLLHSREDHVSFGTNSKRGGFSIRCIQD